MRSSQKHLCIFPCIVSYHGVLRFVADKTVKLWKISERCRRYCNMNTLTDDGMLRDEELITQLRVPVKVQDDISIEAMPRRIFANGHTYHINSISVNSDDCTYLSADDLRINLWDLERIDQSFSILFISCNVTRMYPGCYLNLSVFSLTSKPIRHCGYKTSQHGGVDRGHNSIGVSPY